MNKEMLKPVKKKSILIAILLLCTAVTLKFTFGSRGLQAERQKAGKPLFRFVFLGDSRGDYKADPPVYLAEKYLSKFTDIILQLKPKPEFVIFNGDMVAKTTYNKDPGAIKKWQSIFLAPIRASGIRVYVTVGNHVIDGNAVNPDNSIRYIPLFRKYYQADNPLNGPRGYKAVTYSFSYKNCHFSTVNPFVTHRGIDSCELLTGDFIQKKNDFEYFVCRENRKWLQKDLKSSNSDFNIFFCHCPIVPVGPHYIDRKNSHAHSKNRSEVIKILLDSGIDLYIASHEHVYARANLSPSNPVSSGLKGSFVQVVVGSAGAPLNNTPPRKDMTFEKYLVTYSIMIADVKENRIEFNMYNHNNIKIDSFSINKKK